MNRVRFVIALLLPVIVLGGMLAAQQLPVWTAIGYDDFRTADGAIAPAACEAASLLRTLEAVPAGASGPVTAENALALAQTALAARVPNLPAEVRFSVPAAYALPGDSVEEPVWVITAALDSPRTDPYGIALPGPAAVLLIDMSGRVEQVAISASSPPDPAVACPFDTRGALVDMVRTPVFLLLAGYVALTTLGLIAAGAYLLVKYRNTGMNSA